MPSRLPIASTCLLLSTLGILGLGWTLYGKGGAAQTWGSLLCAYAAGLYIAVGFMSINRKIWVWWVSNAAMGMRVVSVLPMAYFSMSASWKQQAFVASWAALGLLGLWALYSAGTKAEVASTSDVAA